MAQILLTSSDINNHPTLHICNEMLSLRRHGNTKWSPKLKGFGDQIDPITHAHNIMPKLFLLLYI